MQNYDIILHMLQSLGLLHKKIWSHITILNVLRLILMLQQQNNTRMLVDYIEIRILMARVHRTTSWPIQLVDSYEYS